MFWTEVIVRIFFYLDIIEEKIVGCTENERKNNPHMPQYEFIAVVVS